MDQFGRALFVLGLFGVALPAAVAIFGAPSWLYGLVAIGLVGTGFAEGAFEEWARERAESERLKSQRNSNVPGSDVFPAIDRLRGQLRTVNGTSIQMASVLGTLAPDLVFWTRQEHVAWLLDEAYPGKLPPDSSMSERTQVTEVLSAFMVAGCVEEEYVQVTGVEHRSNWGGIFRSTLASTQPEEPSHVLRPFDRSYRQYRLTELGASVTRALDSPAFSASPAVPVR